MFALSRVFWIYFEVSSLPSADRRCSQQKKDQWMEGRMPIRATSITSGLVAFPWLGHSGPDLGLGFNQSPFGWLMRTLGPLGGTDTLQWDLLLPLFRLWACLRASSGFFVRPTPACGAALTRVLGSSYYCSATRWILVHRKREGEDNEPPGTRRSSREPLPKIPVIY